VSITVKPQTEAPVQVQDLGNTFGSGHR